MEIRLDSINHQYAGVDVLRDISLDIKSGGPMAVLIRLRIFFRISRSFRGVLSPVISRWYSKIMASRARKLTG